VKFQSPNRGLIASLSCILQQFAHSFALCRYKLTCCLLFSTAGYSWEWTIFHYSKRHRTCKETWGRFCKGARWVAWTASTDFYWFLCSVVIL